jgi:DNA-directed RNA polymerase subunit RPC12/RpoP
MDDEKIKNTTDKPKYKKIVCNVCGSRIYLSNRSRHERTKKHKDVLYIQTERIEFK